MRFLTTFQLWDFSDTKELDAVTNALATQPGVRHATWSVRTVE